MERRTKFNVFYILFAVFAMLAVQEGWRRAQTIEVVPYSEFEKYLEEDRIAEVTVSDQHITISQYRQRVRPVQQGVGRGTAVARVALVSIARHSREKPLSIHFAEAITKHFNHVHVPLSVEIDAERGVQLGLGRRAVALLGAAAGDQHELVGAGGGG